VSGGGRGIGRAICLALGDSGHPVAVADLRPELAEETASAISGRGGTAAGVPVDVTDTASVRVAVKTVEEILGPIQVLVNNAGWDSMRLFVDTDEDFWDRVIEVNFKGALRLTHLVLPGMQDRGWGRLVNVASDAGRIGSAQQAVYSGAKGGLIAFTKTIARESARRGVTANAVCPGPTRTPLVDEMYAGDDTTIARLARLVPMNRLGEPRDVAAAVAFFASEAAGYVTGQTLSVSGGLSMAG
jgi:2-hydroxycyclohexanecarboxyl-CoA dehydrogenase